MNFDKFLFSRNDSRNQQTSDIFYYTIVYIEIELYPTTIVFFFFLFFLNLLSPELHELFNTKVQLEILLAPVLVYGSFEIYMFFTRVTRCMQHALRIRPNT